MKKPTDRRTTQITVQVTAKQAEQIRRRLARTTCRNMSQFARQVLLGKPVTFNIRNQSQDELLWELCRLRMDLLRIEESLEVGCKIQASGPEPSQLADCKRLLSHIEQIKAFIAQTAQRWLPS